MRASTISFPADNLADQDQDQETVTVQAFGRERLQRT